MRGAVLVVTYESADHLEDCLESVRREGDPELVVVDNASTDESPRIAERFGARVIVNSLNAGFAAAVNQAAAAASGDLLILLNPDARMFPGCLTALTERLRDREIGVAGCKVLDADGRTLQHMGGEVAANGLTRHIGRGEVDRGQYDHLSDVPYVTGAALGIRRGTWDDLGGLAAAYHPAYFEEVELCHRAREHGLRVVVVPGAVVAHGEAASFGQGSTAVVSRAYYDAYHRNRIRFVRRNYTVWQLLTRFLPAEAAWLIRARPRDQLRSLLRAYRAGLGFSRQ